MSGYPYGKAGGGYPPASSMAKQLPRQHGGYEHVQYQHSYPEATESYSYSSSSSKSSSLYPSLSTPSANDGASAGVTPAYQSQYQHQSSYSGDQSNCSAQQSQSQSQYQRQSYYPGDQSHYPAQKSQYQHQSYCPTQQPSPSTSSVVFEQYQGTVFPAPHFNVEADCQALSQAMKGFGTNERALIDIIANRSNTQRQQIKIQYKSMYGMDLIGQICKELSGHFRETIQSLFGAPADRDAWSLNRALFHGKGKTVGEILLTKSNSEMLELLDAYRRAFNKDLERDINSCVRATDFRRMLVSAIQANRDELTPPQIQQAHRMGIESVIDRNRARQDADALYKAGVGKWGTDEQTFNAIFAQRSYYQLRVTFEEYQLKYRQDIIQAIRSEFSGDIKDAYLLLIDWIRDPPAVFASIIHKSIVGIGTDDFTLIWVIVSRSEIDLAQIKQRYYHMFKHTVAEDVRDDTSGDYRQLLLAIVK